jgi:hypothetical protein
LLDSIRWPQSLRVLRTLLQFSVLGALDAHFVKFFYALLVNFVVVFLIVAIMNTIGSRGLPGRQQLAEKTAFQVFLECFSVKEPF